MKTITRILFAFLVCSLSTSAFAEDRLVLVSASYGKDVVAICEANGDVIWRHDTPGPKKGTPGTTMCTC